MQIQSHNNCTNTTESNSPQEESFEKLIEEAKAILNKLNSQDITLQESLTLYENGMQSLKNAQKILEQAKLRYQEFKD